MSGYSDIKKLNNIMTREEAREIALKMCIDSIEKNGEYAIYVAAPQPGKNTWTWKEAYESIVTDTCLENTKHNIIDSIIEFYSNYK